MPTIDQILNLAGAAVPEHLRPAGRVVQRGGDPGVVAIRRAGAPGAAEEKADPQEEMARRLAARFGGSLDEDDPDAVDVEYPEATAAGIQSTTIVQLRRDANGALAVAGVFKRA